MLPSEIAANAARKVGSGTLRAAKVASSPGMPPNPNEFVTGRVGRGGRVVSDVPAAAAGVGSEVCEGASCCACDCASGGCEVGACVGLEGPSGCTSGEASLAGAEGTLGAGEPSMAAARDVVCREK